MPDVELRGESAHYLLLVQGSDNAGSGGCSARVVHSDGQINGAAAMATVSGFLREKSSSGILFSCHVCRGQSLCATLTLSLKFSKTSI